MCGPIAATLRAPRPLVLGAVTPRRAANLEDIGRLSSYAVLGAAAGLIGSAAILARAVLPIQTVLLVLFNGVLVAVALQMMGVLGRWRRFEAASLSAWRVAAPVWRRFWPPRTGLQHLGAGVSWGFMPCGLIYSVLPLAVLSASPVRGAVLLVAFGLGTLPALRLVSSGAPRLLRSPRWRIAAGVAVLVVAGFGLIRAAGLATHPRAWLDQALAVCTHLF